MEPRRSGPARSRAWLFCMMLAPMLAPVAGWGVARADVAPPAPKPAAVGLGELDVRFEGLRSAKGMLRACLTRNPAFFPKCDNDPVSFKASVAAKQGAQIAFGDVPPGDYALLVLHDENGNSKVDTLMGIPREGVGFSRNPRIMFGPPSFKAVRIHVPAGASATDVKLQYFF